MYLSRLVLNNFQKHVHLELNITPGVNYIYGASDAGKSCVRRAIGFLFFGDPRTDVIRREGTKQTSVLGVLDNGIEVERIKSATVNRYVVRKEGKELVYDSVGASIPEEVQKVLQVITLNVDDKEKPLNLNVAEQISLPFLLDKSGSFRLKLFNKLTGNDLLDKLVTNFNKEMLQISKDIKSEQEFISINEPKLQEVTIQHAEKAKLLGNFSELRSKLLNKVETYKKLRELSVSIAELNVDLQFTKKKLDDIKIIPESLIGKLKVIIDKWIHLDDLKGAYDENKRALVGIKVEMDAIKVVDVDVSTLRDKALRIETLLQIKKRLSDMFDSIQKTILTINDTQGNIKILESQYQTKLKEAGVCPICKQSTSNCEVHNV